MTNDEFYNPRERQAAYPTFADYCRSRDEDGLVGLIGDEVYRRNAFGSYPGTIRDHALTLINVMRETERAIDTPDPEIKGGSNGSSVPVPTIAESDRERDYGQVAEEVARLLFIDASVSRDRDDGRFNRVAAAIDRALSAARDAERDAIVEWLSKYSEHEDTALGRIHAGAIADALASNAHRSRP